MNQPRGDRAAQVAALKHPWKRAELAAYLKDASRNDLFEKPHQVRFVVNFFFDDHDFAPDASKEIGWVLLDDKEAAVINAFVHTLDGAIGPKSKPLSDLSREDWKPVAIAAAQALANFSP